MGVLANMVFISMFGSILMTTEIGTTNIGNLWYATVVMAQMIILERFGLANAALSVTVTYATLVTMFALSWCISLFPWETNFSPQALASITVADWQTRIVVSSMTAFGLSQIIMLLAWQRIRQACPALPAMMIGTILAQAIDTPVFFIAAFGNVLPAAQVFEAIVVGFVVKMGAMLALIPAYLLALHWPSLAFTVRGSRAH
jgi:uncharacterized integral membrane protein (TIGR00697 family)